MLKSLGNNFGYGYDSLLVDLARWDRSPFVTIDSIGASVQNRALWQLTITDTASPPYPRKTVYIHARTHPNEVQGWWVTNEIINLLLSDDLYASMLRDSCVFYIIPMYNPDGVELEYYRENANRVDIESGWSVPPGSMEPEVVALHQRFTELMASDAPIEIALNMHASGECKRYFVYHDAVGTSAAYAVLERQFIGAVRSYFPAGIQPWDHFVSWTTGTPSQYPESWFWRTHGASVMALTYEDMNCPEAGAYDSTAYALLHGIGDYLGLPAVLIANAVPPYPDDYSLEQNYPNPFNAQTTIFYHVSSPGAVRLLIYNLAGRQVASLVDGYQPAGSYNVAWQPGALPSGIYLYRLQTGRYESARKCILLK